MAESEIKSPFKPWVEKRLYDTRRDLWAVTRVMVHAPEYKKLLWARLPESDREILIQAIEDSRK